MTVGGRCQLRPGRISSSLVCAEKHLPERNTLEGVLVTEQSERGWKTARALFVRSTEYGVEGGEERPSQQGPLDWTLRTMRTVKNVGFGR